MHAQFHCSPAQAALQWRMPELTRRRSLDASDECWHVRVGTIIARSTTGGSTLKAKASGALAE
jgi:hypothetical protein